MPASSNPLPVATDEPIVWSVTSTNNDAAVLECYYGDYHGRVVKGFGIPGAGDQNTWSAVVNSGSGKLRIPSEAEAKQHCETVIRAQLASRLAAAKETFRLFGALA